MGGSNVVILVVDDEESVRKLVAFTLQSDGYLVLIAGSGTEAVELCRRHDGHIDLLISDLLMPGMNGVELAQVLTKERPQTRVLLISGSPEMEVPPTFQFLKKPFTIAALREAVAGVLGSTGPQTAPKS
jgi:two-component system, cell cycle sensor histidine kinase and response regulator CckA